jgi:hypothetical protein
MDKIKHLGSHGVAWTDPTGRGWSLVFHFAEIDGVAEVIGLDVRGFRERAQTKPTDADGPHPLTASTLRALPFGAQADRARAWARTTRSTGFAKWRQELDEGIREELERQGAAFAEPEAKARRTRWTTGALQEAAHTYTTALAGGERPTQAVADHFGISHSMAAKVVRRARDAGLLPETTQGRAAGLPRNRGERT